MTDYNRNPYQSPTTYSARDDDTEYEYAGFWVRVVAAVLDTLLIGIVFFVISLALSYMFGYTGLKEPGTPSTFDVIVELMLQVAALAFVVFCWVKYAGTPAKLLFGLKVLDAETGEHLTVGKAILRYLGYILSSVILCLGLIWVAFDKKKQGWHDKLAKSVVVKERR